jgi:hypothetical protein
MFSRALRTHLQFKIRSCSFSSTTSRDADFTHAVSLLLLLSHDLGKLTKDRLLAAEP